jgi:hypothetical protein
VPRSLIKRLYRSDSQPFDTRKIYTDSDGNMRCPVVIAKTGVLEYTYLDDKDAEVTVREAKLPEELLTKQVIFSAEGKAVTREHPSEMVDSTNFFKYQKGTFINPKIVGDEIHGEVVIYDKVLQEEIKGKERYQISPGFWSSTEFQPGTLDGKTYDAAQRDIEINHIAIVKEGRAGNAVRVKLDSKEVQDMKIKMKNGRAVVLDEDGKEKKIEAYEQARDAEGEDKTPEDKKPDAEGEDKEKPPMPPQDKKPDADEEEKNDEEVDMESLPEAAKALIQQLMTENARLKGENADRQDSNRNFGRYLEARDFALKYVTDKQLQPNHDSADYYKRAVVEATGCPASALKGVSLDSAYAVASRALVSLRKAKLDVYEGGNEAQTELEKQVKIAEANNGAFSGRRVVKEQ